MDPADRQYLSSICKQLASLVHLNGHFLSFLILHHVFTLPMMLDILSKADEKEIKEKLILELQSRGPEAFEKFLSILELTNQVKAADLMKKNPPEAEQDISKDVNVKPTPQISVKHATILKSGPDIFPMISKPRGKCLIINNMEFVCQTYREGSELDAAGLTTVFEQLGFLVTQECNLSAEQMKRQLKNFAEDPGHKLMDSCAVIILSHGLSGRILGVDEESVYYEYIFNLFNNETCILLKHKPKMFFFQACRGIYYDSGVPKNKSFNSNLMFDSGMPGGTEEGNLIERMPTCTDILVSYSTVDGYISTRRPSLGSWYCQALIYSLAKYAWDTDFENIIKLVDRIVQNSMSETGDMQATEWTHRGWNKTLFFNPGL